MITLINKKAPYNDITLSDVAATSKSKHEWCEYIGDPLYTDTTVDGETVRVSNFPLEYRKGILEVETETLFNECTLDMMDATEQTAKDTDIENERISTDEFKGYKYRIETSPSVVDPTSPFHATAFIALIDKNDSECEYHEVTGVLTKIVSYWNNITAAFMNQITNNPDVFTLYTNPLA